MGFLVQERQDNQLQQELQELMQEKEDDSEEDTSDDLEVDAGILALHEKNPDCIGWLTIDGGADTKGAAIAAPEIAVFVGVAGRHAQYAQKGVVELAGLFQVAGTQHDVVEHGCFQMGMQ